MRARLVRLLLLGACATVGLSAASQQTQVFTGIVTDDMCPMADHSRMKMGANDAECARACITAHGGQYVLYDGKRAYVLADGDTPERFAAQKVRVTGRLDAKTMTIHVESMTTAG